MAADLQGANERLRTIKVHPLDPSADWTEPSWLDLSGQPQNTTPAAWETNLDYWRALHEVIDAEPHLDSFSAQYGEPAALGIAKGKPFAPDQRMTGILEQAARVGNGQRARDAAQPAAGAGARAGRLGGQPAPGPPAPGCLTRLHSGVLQRFSSISPAPPA